MEIFHDIDAWRRARDKRPPENALGFVPTMGNLHIAHLSLVEHSQQENTDTLVSLFVNKTQFNKPDDFANYPRTLDADLEHLQRAGVRYCLIPSPEAIYPDGFGYRVHETTNKGPLEGQHRPGHFTGVLTVVMKLLHLAKPQRVYLGEKDYEQFQLISDMVRAFLMDIEVKVCPTIRDASGLAYSSRNNQLTPETRAKAEQFARIFHLAPSCDKAIEALRAKGIDVEYIDEHDGRRFAAINLDGVRLIDNYSLDPHLRPQTPPPQSPNDA